MEIKEKEMTERQTELQEVEEIEVGGETQISDDVFTQIAGTAAKEIEGVAVMGKTSITRSIAKALRRTESRATGVESSHGKKEAVVLLSFTITYGYSIPEIIIEVRKNVASRIFDICGYITKEVNIEITGIEFPERLSGRLQ